MRNAHPMLIGGTLAVGVVGGGIVSYVVQSPDRPPRSVVVDDTIEILDDAAVREAVESMEFHEPTDVVIYTRGGGEVAEEGSLELNDAVLSHAWYGPTEWLSPDRQRWTDDIFIFAVDPDARLVGTYFGDNREVSEGAQSDIQEAAKEDFRAGRWDAGVIAGVQDAAPRLGAPLIRHEGGVVAAIVLSFFALYGWAAWAGTGILRSRRNARSRSEADERLATMRQDATSTERDARRIPEESRYGSRVLRRYDEFRRGVQDLADLEREAGAIPRTAYNRRETTRTMRAYLHRATRLDHLDDSIADTATFINREPGWQQAWERQVAPLRADLDHVEPMLTKELAKGLRGLSAGAALQEAAKELRPRLEGLLPLLESRELTPDGALDEARAVQERLTLRLEALTDAVVQTLGSTERQRTSVRHAIEKARANAPTRTTILSTAYPSSTPIPVHTFHTGVVAGSQSISSGSSSGYSGGGFSGGGSSSSF